MSISSSKPPAPSPPGATGPAQSRRPARAHPFLILALLLGLMLMLDRLIWAGGQMVLRHSQFRFAALYDGRLTGAVAIFGNSRAVHGFYAPDLSQDFCRPVVSLAANGIGMETVAALVEDARTRLPGLQVAVIEVTSLFAKDGGTVGFRTFAPQSPALAARLAETHQSVLPWHRIFRSSALNSDLFYRSLAYLTRSDQTWINRGGVVTRAEIARARTAAMPVLSDTGPSDAGSSDAGLTALEKTLKRLETAGIEPVLIAAPVHSVLQDGAWPAQLSDRLDHPVHDLRAVLPDGAGFADPIHLNLRGARALMPHLPDRLRRCAP